jgi:hypothetical protein
MFGFWMARAKFNPVCFGDGATPPVVWAAPGLPSEESWHLSGWVVYWLMAVCLPVTVTLIAKEGD